MLGRVGEMGRLLGPVRRRDERKGPRERARLPRVGKPSDRLQHGGVPLDITKHIAFSVAKSVAVVEPKREPVNKSKRVPFGVTKYKPFQEPERFAVCVSECQPKR